ncbi:hypothetical protein A2V82_16365 [candidate division KSB1 bacterium RBG_16_48_16]|nr:MAG: hypothetical protein A2V82_16365 [candidate division KSB1 bacterium RBG_16_48_16]
MSTYKKIEAVRKTGEVLKYLSSQKDAVTGPELGKAVNLPVGTVMCHLATLEEMGFVQSVGDGYRLGMGLALIWARVKSNLEGDRVRVERDLGAIQ